MDIKDRIQKVNGLNILDLSNAGLLKIPKSVYRESTINFLYLSGNNIHKIPESIKSMAKLFLLDISNNGIRAFPEAILNLSNLRELNISRNYIDEIPDEIDKLGELRRININSNKLKKIPESICSLKHIKWIYLHSNPINFIPDNFNQGNGIEIRLDEGLFLKDNFLDESKGINFDKDDGIPFIGHYHRYWNYYPNKHKNPKFDSFSGKVLDLKNLKIDAINYFYGILEKKIRKNIRICAVPSSIAEKKDSGTYRLVKKLAKDNNRLNCLETLIRHTSVEPAHSGGKRSIQKHLSSIEISESDLIKGKDVLIIDDVYTSGNSIRACKKILIEKGGARFVQPFVLGRTVQEDL